MSAGAAPPAADIPPAGQFAGSPWEWMARMRVGKVYQPAGPADAAADPNGCLPKLGLIENAGYDLGGRSLVSLGAASGLYELGLAEAAVRRGTRPSAVHLVDTDADALATAAARAAELGLADFRTVRAAADEFTFERRYDVCFFLSLYHHYDRLGSAFRSRGMRVLQEIGQRCATLFFETGQTDDTVPGSELWPRMLEMGSYPSPTHWLESRVPEMTGYDSFVRLGTNPATNRHLYVFWKARRVALDASRGTAFGELALDRAPGGAITAAGPEGVRPLAEAAASLADGQWMLHCTFSHGTPEAARDRDFRYVQAVLDGVPREAYVLVLTETSALSSVPDGMNAAFRVSARSEEDAVLQLRTAAYSGFTMAAAPPEAAGAALADAARSLGVRLAVTAR
jgi:hypothetical protein